MIRPDTWLLDRWQRLGRGARIAAVAAVAVGLSGFSVLGYRQYRFMMHDNEFCLSCHLMTNAYERFQRSVHNELSCHTCHPAGPNQVWQLYSTVFLSPTEVKKHAHVPNKVCANCHIKGDPTRWKIIANTAGHRIHLEGSAPALQGIQCVDCHTIGVHEFSPNRQTCLRSSCHPDARIQLGRMGSLDIYCTTCHNFTAQAARLVYDSLGTPLSPRAQQCFACHEMQQALGSMEFTHDPHQGDCGKCHNPHRQTAGAQAAQGCTSGSCHTTWRESPFHNGVPNPEACTRCHIPHSWKVEGRNCTRCHQDVMSPSRPSHPQRAADAAAVHPDVAER